MNPNDQQTPVPSPSTTTAFPPAQPSISSQYLPAQPQPSALPEYPPARPSTSASVSPNDLQPAHYSQLDVAQGPQPTQLVYSASQSPYRAPEADRQQLSPEPKSGSAIRVKVVAIVLLCMAAMAVVTGILEYGSITTLIASSGSPVLQYLPFIAAGITTLVAIGLLKYNKIAYRAFNIVALLYILNSLLTVPVLITLVGIMPSLVSAGGFSFLDGLRIVSGFATPVIWIVGGVMLHPKSVRQLFGIR